MNQETNLPVRSTEQNKPDPKPSNQKRVEPSEKDVTTDVTWGGDKRPAKRSTGWSFDVI